MRSHHGWVRRLRRVAGLTAGLVVAVLAPAASLSSSAGPLTLLVEPNAHVAAPFVAMIAGARRSVDMTMYELADTQVEHALAAAHRRRVAVRVLLGNGYYGH